ncbi:MAG: MbcA/ParS/Xre antitoxin family protein [Anaeromyxobacteraceae bacterium]
MTDDEIRAILDRLSGSEAMDEMPLSEEDCVFAHQLRDLTEEQFLRLVRDQAQAFPILGRARALLGDLSLALDWLRTPNFGLGGESPLDLLGTENGAARVLGVLPEGESTPDEPDVEEHSPEDQRRIAFIAALPENPPNAHHAAVQQARIVIAVLADAAWTILRTNGDGQEAREAVAAIGRAMNTLDKRTVETQATLALIDAIARGASDLQLGKSIDETDRFLTGFWWDWPTYANRLPLEIYREAVLRWVEGEKPGSNARWKPVAEAVAKAGLPPQKDTTLRRLWRRHGPGSPRPRGV